MPLLISCLDFRGTQRRILIYEAELKEREKLGKPEHDDWENVKRFCEFLGRSYELTLCVSESKYVTTNLFFHELVNVSALLKELSVGDDFEMSTMANKMKEKYDKYWGDLEKINLVF